MTRARRLYPLLFALFPLFGMAARNPGWYRLRSVFLIACIVIAATALLRATLTALFRIVSDRAVAADRGAFAAFLVVVIFYAFDPFPLGAIKTWTRAHLVISGVLGIACIVAAGVGVARRWFRRVPPLASIGAYLTLVGTLVCAWSLARVLYYPVATAVAVRRSALIDSLERPVALRPGATIRGPKRDVIVVVLDEYASEGVLRDRFGFDNSRFEDSLRALGFRIPTALRSNYANTLLSVGSLVNFAQTAGIASAAGPGSRDYGPGAYLIEHNRAARFLKAQGYRYVVFASTWYAPTRYSSEADVEFYPYRHFRIGRRIFRSEFIQDFAQGTLLSHVLSRLADRNTVYRDHVVRTLDGLGALEPTRQPTFAFVHVLMPHTPYVVDATCRAASLAQRDPRSAAGQLTCLDSLVLQTVTSLLTHARVPPVIILEGDHGTASLGIFEALGMPSRAQVAERFQPFGAYYLPDGGGATVPDTTSVVNVLRYVFSYYFAADLPPLPNTMYYSHWKSPYRLVRVAGDFSVSGAPPIPVQSRASHVRDDDHAPAD